MRLCHRLLPSVALATGSVFFGLVPAEAATTTTVTVTTSDLIWAESGHVPYYGKPTGIMLTEGGSLSITVSEVDFWGYYWGGNETLITAEGVTWGSSGYLNSTAFAGSLAGSIGFGALPFAIGTAFNGIADASGELHLGIYDNTLWDNILTGPNSYVTATVTWTSPDPAPSPIPLPATGLLLIGGLASLFGAGVRRSRAGGSSSPTCSSPLQTAQPH